MHTTPTTIHAIMAHTHDDDDTTPMQYQWVNPMLRYPTRTTTTKEEG